MVMIFLLIFITLCVARDDVLVPHSMLSTDIKAEVTTHVLLLLLLLLT